MGRAKKIDIDHDDYEWEDGWDDRVVAAVLAEAEKKRAARMAAKDGRKAEESIDE